MGARLVKAEEIFVLHVALFGGKIQFFDDDLVFGELFAEGGVLTAERDMIAVRQKCGRKFGRDEVERL